MIWHTAYRTLQILWQVRAFIVRQGCGIDNAMQCELWLAVRPFVAMGAPPRRSPWACRKRPALAYKRIIRVEIMLK